MKIKAEFHEFYNAVKYIEKPIIGRCKINYKGTWITVKGDNFKIKSFMEIINEKGKNTLDFVESYRWHYLTESIGKTKHSFLADHNNFLAIVKFLDEESSMTNKDTEIEIEISGRTRTFKVNNSTLTIILSEDYPSYPSNFIFKKRQKQQQCANS